MTVNAQESLTRWLLSHRKPLFSYINAIVRDHALSEDVFQDASIVILKKTEYFDTPKLWPFARGVAKNLALRAVRSRRTQSAVFSAKALEGIDRGFDQVADDSELRVHALDLCIKALPENWRQIVRLRYWSNLSISAISHCLDNSENTLSVTLNRIRSRLASCVSQRLESEKSI